MNIALLKCDGDSETLSDCERKMAAFCAIDAYQGYDVRGRPSDPNVITEGQIAATNSAMRARAPLWPWEKAGLLRGPRDELKCIRLEYDLVAMRDQQWHRVRAMLQRLYDRVLPVKEIGPARGTKVLHLMRPRLVAIADRVVLGYLEVPAAPVVQRALALADRTRCIGRTGDNRTTLGRIQAYLAGLDFVKRSGVIPSACRVLDALLWMRGSERYDHLWAVMGVDNP